MMMSMRRLTSAWKVNSSAPARLAGGAKGALRQHVQPLSEPMGAILQAGRRDCEGQYCVERVIYCSLHWRLRTDDAAKELSV